MKRVYLKEEFKMSRGEDLYASIIARNPDIERNHLGKTICIDLQTRKYEIGEGLDPFDRLIARTGADDSRLYSRLVGIEGRARLLE